MLFNSNVDFFLMLFKARSHVHFYKFMRLTPHWPSSCCISK